jgi:hypothetical protein
MVMSGLMDKVSNFAARKEDIFVASYPKSGTTWLQQVVYLLCTDSNDEEEPKDSNEVMEWRFPYLEHIYPGLKEINSRPGQRLIKTHLPVELLPSQVAENGSKVIYIYRNPKDVIVSYYHFAKMLTFANFKGTLDQFAWLLLLDKVPYSPYFPHINGYLEASQKNPKQYLVVNYEDMKEDPKAVIRQIAHFLIISDDLNEDALDDICEQTSFEAMKSNPATNYSHWDVYGLRNTNEAQFMRKGKYLKYVLSSTGCSKMMGKCQTT